MKRVVYAPCPVCHAEKGQPCINKRSGQPMKHAHIVRLPEHHYSQLNMKVAAIEKDPDPDGFWYPFAWDLLGLGDYYEAEW